MSISESFYVKDTFDFLLFTIRHLLATIQSATGHSVQLLEYFLSQLRSFYVCKGCSIGVNVWQYFIFPSFYSLLYY